MANELTPQQAFESLERAGATGWLCIPDAISTRISTGGFATGLALLDEIGEAAEQADHHPDLTLRWGSLDVRLTSHDAGGVTERDVAMATRVGELAAARDLAPSDRELALLELALDTPARDRIKSLRSPFAAARGTTANVLTFSPRLPTDLWSCCKLSRKMARNR